MNYYGTDQNDVINQGELSIADNTTVYAGNGDDSISIVGSARVVGGSGNDTIEGSTTSSLLVAYWDSPSGIVVDLRTGKAQDGFGTVDTLKNVKDLHGSSFDDLITGTSADEGFWLGAGSNTVIGGGGRDSALYVDVKSTEASISYDAESETFTIVKNFANGDHGTDILKGIQRIDFHGPESDNVSLYKENYAPEGGFLGMIDTSSVLFPEGTYLTQLRSGDFNGDGLADFYFSTRVGLGTELSPLYIFLGEGNGQFVNGTSSVFRIPPLIKDGGARTLIGDFNRDGASDIFQLDFGLDAPPGGGGLNRLYLSIPGSQRLEDRSHTLAQERAQNHSGSTGDVNGDGFIDLLINTYDQGNHLYLNDGTGHFMLSPDSIPHLTIDNQLIFNPSSGIVDVNGDGAQDIVLGVADGSPAPGQVLINDGTGNFTKIPPIALPTSGITLEAVMDVKGLDLNGDSLTDLMLSVTRGGGAAVDHQQGDGWYETAYIQLLVNQGGGKFLDETEARLPKSVQNEFAKGWFIALEAVDMNRDGHPDIVATAVAPGRSVVLMNEGEGTFYKIWESDEQGQTVTADLDGDGMLDLLTNFRGTTFVDLNKLPNGHIYKAEIDGNNLKGSPGNDTLFGTLGDDTLSGFNGDDRFYSSEGDDVFEGGDGIDNVTYTGNHSDFVLRKSGDNWVIQDTRSTNDNEGTDTLVSVERLGFSEQAIALDTEGPTSAGSIYRLYKATFNREPDTVGLGYWIAQADAGNKDAVRMAEDFVWSQEFQDLYDITTIDNYGTGTDVEALVTGFYENVLGRTPDQGGLDFYTGVIESKERTVGRVLAEISDSQENYDGTIELIANGIVFDPWVG